MIAGDFLDMVEPEFSSRVVVAGMERAALSWGMSRATGGGMPSIGGGNSAAPATGQITFAPVRAVSERPASPWSRAGAWPPVSGDRVQIFVSDGVTEWQRFEGKIDTITGVGAEGEISARIVDDWDALERPYRCRPVATWMPSKIEPDKSTRLASVELSPAWQLMHALDTAGFRVMPSPEDSTYIRLTPQGGVYPYDGQPRRAAYGPTTIRNGIFVANVDLNATSTAGIGVTSGAGPRSPATGVQVTVLHAGGPGTSDVNAFFDSSWEVRGPSTAIRVQVTATSTTISWQHKNQTITYPAQDRPFAVGAFLYGDTMRWLTPAGEGSSTGWQATTETVTAAGAWGDHFAGLAVASPAPSTAFWRLRGYRGPRVNVAWVNALAQRMDCTRLIERSTCGAVIQEIAEATCTAVYLDERGVMQVVPAEWAQGQPPVGVIQAERDLFSLGWSEDSRDRAATVTVGYQAVALERSEVPRVLLKLGGGSAMTTNETREEFWSPASDEEWVAVDENFGSMTGGREVEFNRGTGSWHGGLLMDGDTEAGYAGYPERQNLDVTVERLGTSTTYLITTGVKNLGTDQQVDFRTSAVRPTLRGGFRYHPLPVLRGWVRAFFREASVAGKTELPADLMLGHYIHDMRHWCTAGDAKRMADWLSARLTVARPTLDSLDVAPDPRRQLLDVVDFRSPQILNAKLVAQITSLREEFSAEGGLSQTVGLVVLSGETDQVTWGMVEDAYTGSDWARLESNNAKTNWGGFQADPLRGT